MSSRGPLAVSVVAGVVVAAGCAAGGGVLPVGTASPTAVVAVTVDPLAAATVSPAVQFVRPAPPGPLPGELVRATAEAGRCPEPYLTPPAEPSPSPTPTPAPPPATPPPLRIAAPTAVPPPPPLSLPPLAPDAALEQRIRARLGDQAPHYAVYVNDLVGGRGVSIDGDRVFYAASLFKLEVLYEIFHQRAAGLLSLDERYVPTDYYTGFGLGPRLLVQCRPASIGQALAAMMSVSDNTAAVMLQDRAGARNINGAMAALGLQHTQLTEDQTLPGTAADFARLLEAIARGVAVDRASSQAMADLLATETVDDRIPRHLPAGTLVAHKTGNWTDATHDAGIVYGPRGPYVIVLMSDIGFDGDAGSVEADVSRIVWDALQGAAAPAGAADPRR